MIIIWFYWDNRSSNTSIANVSGPLGSQNETESEEWATINIQIDRIHFLQVGETPPKTITVVLPVRMSAPSKQLSLRNRFSVGLLPLCISEANGKPLIPLVDENKESKCERLLERLGDVSKCSRDLRRKPDYLINYWVMTWLSAALPKKLLKPFLKSHSTMVFSNLPGPNEINILGNHLKKVAFWIPHRYAKFTDLIWISSKKYAAQKSQQNMLSKKRQFTTKKIIIRNEIVSLKIFFHFCPRLTIFKILRTLSINRVCVYWIQITLVHE